MEQTLSLAEGLVAKLEEQVADGDNADPEEEPAENGGGEEEDEEEEEEEEDSEDVRFNNFVRLSSNPDDP